MKATFFAGPAFILTLSLITSIGVDAQTADDIVNKHIAAIGGNEKLKAMKTLYEENTASAGLFSLEVKSWVRNNKCMRVEMSIFGKTVVQIITPENGWILEDQKDPKPMESEDLTEWQSNLDITGDLFDYQAKGKKIELLGSETVDRVSTYKLKVTDKDSSTSILYLDQNTFYIVKKDEQKKGKKKVSTSFMSDYRKTDDGYVFAFKTKQTTPSKAKIRVHKVEVNMPMEDELFKIPGR